MSSASYGMLEEADQLKSTKQLNVEDFLYIPEGHNKKAANHLKIIGADVAHERNLFGEGVKVAVIDQGWFDCESDTKNALTEATKQRMGQFKRPAQSRKEHPNRVSSLIAGKQGIAPQVQLEVFSQPTNTIYGPDKKDYDQKWPDWCAQAIHQAIEAKVHFINMSLTVAGDLKDEIPQSVENALYAARDARIGVILSAGNDLGAYLGSDRYPNFSRIVDNMKGYLRLAVSTSYSIDSFGKIEEDRAYFSTILGYGTIMNCGLAAPGMDILSCRADSEEVIWKGTSTSAPIITASTALVYEALVKSQAPDVDGAKVFEVLDKSTRKDKINPQTREEHRTEKTKYPYFSDSYKSYRYKAMTTKTDDVLSFDDDSESEESVPTEKSKILSFDEYLEEDYQTYLKLDKMFFGQGVINIPAALELVAQKSQVLNRTFPLTPTTPFHT